jgi:hypothetical protein
VHLNNDGHESVIQSKLCTPMYLVYAVIGKTHIWIDVSFLPSPAGLAEHRVEWMSNDIGACFLQ